MKLVTIFTGFNPAEAQLVRSRLEAAGFDPFIPNENSALGTEGYAPIAQGMRAALPYIDHFLPAHDLVSLRGLCRTLVRV